MSLFALLVVVMIGAALALLLPPLLRPPRDGVAQGDTANVAIARERLAELEGERAEGLLDAGEYAVARSELERQLAADLGDGDTADADANADEGAARRFGRRAAVALLVALPLATLALYSHLGTPALVAEGAQQAEATPPHALDTMVAGLARRLEENPEDPDGWYMLGRSYMTLERYPEAVAALERLHALVGDHPRALTALADATALSQGGAASGRPAELAAQLLTLEPENTTALWLSGKAALEQGDTRAAITFWERARPTLEENPQMPEELEGLLARARRLAEAHDDDATPTAGAIRVELRIAEPLQARIPPGATLYLFARAASGPPMPLAAIKRPVGDWPLTLTLDDGDLLLPGRSLSSYAELLLGARISASGEAGARRGDLTSPLLPLHPGSSGTATLTIDSLVE